MPGGVGRVQVAGPGRVPDIQEVSGRVIAIAIATEGDKHIHQLVEHVLEIPAAPELLLPILKSSPSNSSPTTSPSGGSDVDQPRNLAKSVTVE